MTAASPASTAAALLERIAASDVACAVMALADHQLSDHYRRLLARTVEIRDGGQPVTWSGEALRRIWVSATHKIVVDRSELDEIAALVAESAREVSKAPDVRARELISGFLRLRSNWQKAGRPYPAVAVTAFRRLMHRAEEIADGDATPPARRAADTWQPPERRQPTPEDEAAARAALRQLRAIS